MREDVSTKTAGKILPLPQMRELLEGDFQETLSLALQLHSLIVRFRRVQ
jgi:hypothetical protein